MPGNRFVQPTAYAVAPVRFHFDAELHARIDGGLGEFDHRVLGVDGHGFLVVDERYWGIAPGTAANEPPGTTQFPDVEGMWRWGRVRFSGAMDAAKTDRVGSCTLCSEKGCDGSVAEDFPGERFTSRVTSAGRLVCLIETGLTPPGDCPGP